MPTEDQNTSVLTVQPEDARALTAELPAASLLSFDLATPPTAPDEWQRAAARRVSEAVGVPDPDGRVWRPDGSPFRTGAEYLGFMRGLAKSGDVWDYAATPELKAFEAADDDARAAIARQALPAADRAAMAAGRAFGPGAAVPEDAPEDVRSAAARLRADREARRAYNRAQTAASEPFAPPRPAVEEQADRAALDAWRRKKEDADLVAAHRDTLLKGNLWAVWLSVAPSLSEKGREIGARAFSGGRLEAGDIADFQRLDETEQAVVAKLARTARNPAAGTLMNTLGDAGIGFLNGVLTLPVNVGRQLGAVGTAIDQHVFGKDAGLIDNAEMNRRARTEQRLMEALDDAPGIDPSGAAHGYLARSLIGAASTLPYMGYASIPGVGVAAVALDFMQRLDDRVAAEGGDVYGQGPGWLAQKAVYGGIYAGIEKLSALPIFKETSDIALKTMFLKLATRHGTAAAEKLVAHIGKETFKETLEEAVQAVIEEHAASVGLGRGPGWREAVKAGVSEFAETAGTMGLVALTGAARQGVRARSAKGRASLAEFTRAALAREAFLTSGSPYGGILAEQAAADAALAGYRDAWSEGGEAALAARQDLTPQQASVLANVFEAESHAAEAARYIIGRDIVARQEADASGAAYEEITPSDAARIVREAGPDAAARLQSKGFSEAGAARVADYFRRADDYAKREARVLADIRTANARDWADPSAAENRAAEALDIAAPLKPLRDLYQRAGTKDGAKKAFREIGFTEEQAVGMAEAFHMEHALATSPQAAAAFRAFYLDSSAELSAAERLKRMTGFDAAPAPEHGPAAARLTLRGPDGQTLGSVLYLPGQSETFDPESAHAAEAVEQATGGAVTAAEWRGLTPEARAAAALSMGLRADGGFTAADESDPSVRATGAQADLLAGRITLAEGAPSATLYHEATHAWLAVMRRAGKLTDADIAKLQERYGPAADGNAAWFNEERLADDIREIAAAADFAPDKSLASRFAAAVRRFAGAARAEASARVAAADARQALYESIVYGAPFSAVGDLAAVPAAKAAPAPKPSPTDGAATAKAEPPAPADAAPEPARAAKRAAEKPSAPKAPPSWSAATPQGGVRVGGSWIIAPRDRFISDTDPRYDFALQRRTRDATAASSEQVASIAAQGTFDPQRLLDSPDTATGAPVAFPVRLRQDGKTETFYMVLSGNGRFRALDAVDADNRGDEYRDPVRAFADERGIPYAEADMTAAARPRLVRVIETRPEGVTLQRVAELSNQNTVLQMTDAEQASADAALVARDGAAALFDANKDGLPSKDGSEEFFAWFVRAAGDASLVDSKGNPTDAARARARRAMVALQIGAGPRGKETVMAFTEQAEALGLERQRDALLMASGRLATLADAKPAYDLSPDLSAAAAALIQIARDRKAKKTADAESHLAQGDMLDSPSAAAAEILRLLDSDRSAEDAAAALRRYAALAAKIDTDTPDMFGEPPAAPADLLRRAAADTKPADTRYSLRAATPEQDAEYLRAVEAGDMETAQRMVDEAAKAAGFRHRLYHGTPTGGFTVFKERPTYLSPSKEVADIYQSSSASSIRTWVIPDGASPETKELYVKATNIFDTRKPAHRRMFYNQFFMKGGEEWSSNGTPLTKKGLPDWTDGRDLHDWFTETRKRFDAMILDEGALPQTDGSLFDRGESVVVWDPAQIKSADPVTRDDAGNVIPLSERFNPANPDIRYSLRLTGDEKGDTLRAHEEEQYEAEKARAVYGDGAGTGDDAADSTALRAEHAPVSYRRGAAAGGLDAALVSTFVPERRIPLSAAEARDVRRAADLFQEHVYALEERVEAGEDVPTRYDDSEIPYFDTETPDPARFQTERSLWTEPRHFFRPSSEPMYNVRFLAFLDTVNPRLAEVLADRAFFKPLPQTPESLRQAEDTFDPDNIAADMGGAATLSETAAAGKMAQGELDLRYSLRARLHSPGALPDGVAEVAASTSVAALSQAALKKERAAHAARRAAGDWNGAEAYAGELAREPATRMLGQYLLAKYHGDIEAAEAVVRKWAKPSEAARLKALIAGASEKTAVTAAVGQKEGNRYNALPIAYADWLAKQIGGYTSPPIMKVKGPPNTGAAMADRTARDYEFAGGEDVDDASAVILVDDVWTSGQTLWSAYEHLKASNPSARVAAFAALASGRYGKNVRPTPKQLTSFWEKSKLTPDSFKERAGNDIGKLTGSEIQAYLLTGKAGPDGAADFFGRGKGGAERDGRGNLKAVGRPRPPKVRYALDLTGQAYGKAETLTAFMAHAAMTGAPVPSRATVARLAEGIGLDSFDYEAMARAARRLADDTVDGAIRKAAASRDPSKAAYAVGELARAAARGYVRSGAAEGERLARSADRIRGMTEAGVRQAMAAVTGADYADIETDTEIDIAASILAVDPKRFQPGWTEKRKPVGGPAAQGTLTDAEADAAAAQDAALPETDEDTPGLTDKERAEIARKRREREARIQSLLDEARKRAESRREDEERRRRAAQARKEKEDRDGPGGEGGGADATPDIPEDGTKKEAFTDALPVDFADRWEAAALLRVWAFDRWKRDNPNRQGVSRDPAKNAVAVEFYRKTAVRELTELAYRLLDPKAPRADAIGMIGKITSGLTANQIERRTALVFSHINRHAVRETRRELVKKFRDEVKRQFIRGEEFKELGVDIDRTLSGAVEEDARYVHKICMLSDRHLGSKTLSPLEGERARLNAILSEREAMTAEDGSPLPVGEEDMQTRKALRQLALLDRYGGMIDMMPGEILDLTGQGLAGFAQEAVALRQRWEEYDRVVQSIRDPLAAAIARGEDDPQAGESALGAVADSLTGMLRLRLDFLTRYAESAKREAGRAAIADFMDLLARGNTDYAVALQEDRAALNRALGEIFARPDGRPDRKRIRAYLARLDAPIPADLSAKLSRQGLQGRMTHGQMLNLLGYLDQWASYRQNIIAHGRAGQAALIRAYTYEDPKTGEVVRALSNEDTLLLEWLRRRFYADKRGGISAVTERVAGRTVESPDPLYLPALMLLNRKAALHVGQGAWQPLAGVFSRRVRNKLDTDESASILDMFHSRSRETALLTAFTERGLILREVLTSRAFQDAVRRYHGPAALSRILKQVEQTLNGGRPRAQTDAQTAAASLAMRTTTYIGLGWNIASAAKQSASLPVWANVVGFRRLGQILLSAPDRDAIRRLKASDEYRVRYGTGPASGMDIATRAAYESAEDGALKRFFADWGLWMNRKVDWIVSAWVGQAIYRDLRAKYIDQGMAADAAERRAVSETFTAIEETQQSGRTENATALTREHGLLGKLVTQFATSPLQQMQYELNSFREWRDLAASGGPEANTREARDRFVRALIINHVMVPALMVAITNLYKAANGGEPDWKKEGFHWHLLIAALMGQFGRVFFAGALAEETLRALFLRKPPRMGQLVPAEGAIRFAGSLAFPVRDIATWDMEHFRADILRVLKSTALTRLPATLYESATK